jgi:hypothetical protein
MACPTDNTLQERFWKHVNKNGPIPVSCPELGPCWIWTGSANQSGYGQIGTSKGLQVVHRLHWTWRHGEIPPGKEVMHRCDTTRCVRLGHLFLGTHTDNMHDMMTKGRNNQPSGDAHYQRKLTRDDVETIRTLWSQGVPQTELAKRYSRKTNTISKIVNRKRWL